MPLVGGGGAGNTAGSNPTGTGTTLNYIGDHCYANSGFLPFTNSAEVTLLDFTTGNSYVLADLILMRNDQNSDNSAHYIYIDDQLVGSVPQNSGSIQMGGQPIIYLFPPQSRIKITILNLVGATTLQGGVSISGRVY